MSKRARFDVAGWLASLLAVDGPSSLQAAGFDRAALSCISPIEVVRLATGRYQAIEFADKAHIDDRMAEITALDPPVQTLVWLAILDHGLAEPGDGARQASYIGMGRLFGPIGRALSEAGMGERATAFDTATKNLDAGPDVYPGAIALGRAFGTKAAFGEAILAYTRADPRTTAWLEAARAQLPDEDRLRALLDALWTLDAPDWLMSWPEPYRVLLLASMFDGEVGNGGVHQYFYNASGDTAPQAVAAMRALGLPTHAETIERGMSFFATPYPTDQEARREAFDHDGFSDWDERLEALTEIVGYDAVKPAMIAYARRHDLLPR